MNTTQPSSFNAVMAFAGDLVASNIALFDFSSALSRVALELGKLDCCQLVLNLESSLPSPGSSSIHTGSSIVWGDRDLFCEAAKKTSMNVICALSNNHMADFGADAVRSTIEALDECHIKAFGAGSSPESARDPLVIELEGLRIGLLAFCSTRKCVGDHLKTEIGKPLSLIDDRTLELIRRLKPQVDHVVVISHWGREFIHYPVPEDREIARAMIDAGASVIVGHHPHVLQGCEIYKGRHIVYSLGNFIFPEQVAPQPLRWNKTERTGAVAAFEFSKSSVKIKRWIPVRLQKNNSFQILEGGERDTVLRKLEKWSEVLKKPKYDCYFERCVRQMTLQRLLIGVSRNIFRPRKKHFIMFFKLLKQGARGRKSFLK